MQPHKLIRRRQNLSVERRKVQWPTQTSISITKALELNRLGDVLVLIIVQLINAFNRWSGSCPLM